MTFMNQSSLIYCSSREKEQSINPSIILGLHNVPSLVLDKLRPILYRFGRFGYWPFLMIIGQLREKLDNVVITSLSAITTSSWSSFIWVSVLSHCPLFSMAKLTFGNELVVTKYSSRGNVMYVGPVTNHHLWR